MAYFLISDFCGFLSITPFKTIPIKNVGGVLKNSGNLQQNRHKNFQNWWRNVWDNWAQSCQPWKLNQQKLSHFGPPLKSYLFGEWYYLYTVSFSKVVLSQGTVYQVFLGVFMMFLAVFHSKIWAQFHFGTFEPYD